MAWQGILAGVLALLLTAGSAGAEPDRQRAAEAEQAFREIVTLWQEGRYEELYARSSGRGADSRERFVDRLRQANTRLACCYDMLREVRVTSAGEESASVRAKLGVYRQQGKQGFVSKSFRLERRDGVWRISRQQVLAFAQGGKRAKQPRRAKAGMEGVTWSSTLR